MYNEQIEQLINAALADGVLTEKEKQVLFKKAESMGIDLDEFEMVLSSKLYEKQKAVEEERKKKSEAAPKSNKMGDVRKCPSCGAIVSSYQVKCPECGYEFSEVAANSTAQMLAQKLNKVSERIGRMEFKDRKGSFWDSAKTASEQRQEEIAKESKRIIEATPIPNTKADLLEFILSLEPRIKSESEYGSTEGIIQQAYLSKYNECLNKAKLSFSDDPMFSNLFKKLDKDEKNKKLKRNFKIVGYSVLAVVIVALMCFIINVEESEYTESECLEDIRTNIKEGNIGIAEDCFYKYKNENDGSCPIAGYDMILSYYMDVDSVDNVIEWMGEFVKYRDFEAVKEKKVYKYLISKGKYDDAKDFFVYKDGGVDFTDYLKDAVKDMCEKGEKRSAINFMNQGLSEMKLSYGEVSQKATRESLRAIINNY